MKEQDVEMMRELVRGGMPVDDRLEEFLEECLSPTEESYSSKVERLSEYLSGY